MALGLCLPAAPVAAAWPAAGTAKVGEGAKGLCAKGPEGRNYCLAGLSEYQLDGHFDKDEQGWCAEVVQVRVLADGRIRIRDWYDANGLIRDEHVYAGTLLRLSGRLAMFRIEGRYFTSRFRVGSGGLVRFDLFSRRLLR